MLPFGSPPQVRGKQVFYYRRRKQVGITPAGAGKTRAGRLTGWSFRYHPRRCGENFGERYEINCCIGSPPQVRGKLAAFLNSLPVIRITPAGAGKTLVEHPRLKTNRNHPRRCGENRHQFRHPRRRKGSPPQVRGKPAALNQTALCPGITPAGAGKTITRLSDIIGAEDHPRRCGENTAIAASMPISIGSPPQVRGKRPMNFLLLLQMRITPAGAGKTYVEEIVDLDSEDHPRRCGENR